MSNQKKIYQIIGIIIAVLVLVLIMLWYYQSQGILRIFPTKEDREIKSALKIDRSKFKPAQGLTNEQFEAKIKELTEQKDIVLKNTKDPNAWFSFGKTKEFLNDHQGAVLAWEIAHKLQPYDFRTLYSMAWVYQYFLKDFVKAENYYREVLALQPDYTMAYDGLMDIYRYNIKEKRINFEALVLEAIQKDKGNEAKYYYALVDFFLSEETQNLDKAKEYLEKLKEKDPKKASELITANPNLQ